MAAQVRPDFAEAALMRAYRSSSMRDHLLARYRNAFAAIVLAQLRNKGFKDGMQVGQPSGEPHLQLLCARFEH